LLPTEVKTVFRDTPARSATASMVVSAKPRSSNNPLAAATICRRVRRAWLARSSDE
jgi:hypothetical protein